MIPYRERLANRDAATKAHIATLDAERELHTWADQARASGLTWCNPDLDRERVEREGAEAMPDWLRHSLPKERRT